MCIPRWPVALAALALAAVASPSRAEPAPDARIARADELFAEGKALLGSNLLQACAKFDESLQYNPAAIGTLLNVALCDEKLGRIASAVDKFSQARDRANEQGLTQHARAAEQHIAALAASVPHVAIKLTETLPGTTIVLDDRLIALEALDDVAVDPGERTIVVSAPSRLPYRATVVIAPAEHKAIVVPALAKSVTITSSRRRIGQIATVVGGAALGAGIGLGLYGRRVHRAQFDSGACQHTDAGDLCSIDGQLETEYARTLGNVGTAVGALGVAVAGVGVYLWLRAPRALDQRVAIAPQLGAGGLGIVAVGRF